LLIDNHLGKLVRVQMYNVSSTVDSGLSGSVLSNGFGRADSTTSRSAVLNRGTLIWQPVHASWREEVPEPGTGSDSCTPRACYFLDAATPLLDGLQKNVRVGVNGSNQDLAGRQRPVVCRIDDRT